ncbi:esterase/lipase family protein [Croceicoccus estronivorus]|uniref:esterase/lipase family protein n=1 Tax=Croceicoccus estronivorus TaxID=1172626 RepID=UPI000B07F122|nr:alpha/beta hydrolase [Croceicoccus estronivorus]
MRSIPKLVAQDDQLHSMAAHEPEAIRRPSLGWALLEPARFAAELGLLALTGPLLATSPRGDGHPVMVLPGFAATDHGTMLLREFLSLIGYEVFPWNLGWNLDQHSAGENGEYVAQRIDAIADQTGRKVSLVGWSLGGVIAREAARRDSSPLRQVITLAGPFAGNPSATSLAILYEMITGNRLSSPEHRERYRCGHRPLAVPSSAIFSKSDGVVAWQNCVSETDAITENIEVYSSHSGFSVNPAVFYAVADRLAQPEQGWSKFVPSGPYRHFFPEMGSAQGN